MLKNDQNSFLETETPLIVRGPSPEAHFSLMQVHGESQQNSGFLEQQPAFLITSPEFQMKRMLVGGFEKIFQICRWEGKSFANVTNLGRSSKMKKTPSFTGFQT